MAVIQRLLTLDYVTMSLVICATVSIGFYQVFSNFRAKVTKDFLVQSRDLSPWTLILSTLATHFSAIGIMGVPQEIYSTGLNFGVFILGNLTLIPFAVFLYIPVLYNLNKNTIFEYLELRFNFAVRLTTSILLTLQMVLLSSIVLYAPALTINQVTGLNMWISVFVVGSVCIVYTAFGGFKAVVWADVAQLMVIFAVLLLICIKGVIDVGGLGVIWQRLTDGQRTQIFIWGSSPYSQYSVWTMVLGNTFHRLTATVLNQSQMQRYLSNKSLHQALRACVIVSVTIFFTDFTYVLIGALAYAKNNECDPLISGQITKRDQILPLFALQTLSFAQGMSGIFTAAILCATLSTLSSLLNSLATLTLSDYIKPRLPNLTEKTTMRLSKCLVLTFGCIAMILVEVMKNFGGVIKTSFAIIGMSSGPILCVFTTGMLVPWVNSTGALIGIFGSMLLPWWVCVGNIWTSPAIPHAPYPIHGCSNLTAQYQNMTSVVTIVEKTIFEEMYTLHPIWFPFWSLTTGLVISVIASSIIGFQDPKSVQSNLLFPFVKRYFYGRPKQETNGVELTAVRKQNINSIA